MADDFDPYHRWLGIAPGQRPPDHYQLLGIPRFESDPDVIASAADRQMAHVRSFQSGKHATTTQRVLNELAAARVCLLTADHKARYDEQLQAALAPPIAPSSTPSISVRTSTRTRRRTQGPRPTTFIWIGLIAGVITGIGATVLAVLLLVPRTGMLAIDMSAADRDHATLEIDGEARTLPAKGGIELSLPRGTHAIAVTRPFHVKYEASVDIVAGETTALKIQLRPLARLTIEITGRRPDNLKVSIDGQPLALTSARSQVVPCEPGPHVVRAESSRGKFERTVTVLPDQNFRVPIAILSDSRLLGTWSGVVEIDQKAVDRRLDQSKSNPLVRAFAQQTVEALRTGQLELQLRGDGSYTLSLKVGPLTNTSSGQWTVTEELGARVTIEFTPQQGAVEYRQLHFEGKDSFRTDLPKDLAGLGQFRCRRVGGKS